jgi:hypothetical protein
MLSTAQALKRASRILGGSNNRALTDKQIVLVREYLDLNKTNTQIGELLRVDAAIVSKVKAGILVTQPEERTRAKAAGVHVDAVFAMASDGIQTQYRDIWAAASLLDLKSHRVHEALDSDRRVGGFRWSRHPHSC